MSRSIMRLAAFFAPTLALVACGGGSNENDVTENRASPLAKSTSPTQTAQAIWADFGAADQEIIVQENRKYEFVSSTAQRYYDNANLTTTVSWNCSGSATNCAFTNQPQAPQEPPPPWENMLSQAQAVCTFWEGGTLPNITGSITSGRINGLNGAGNWTATWSYRATPAPSDVDPRTAFPFTVLGSDAGLVEVELDGFIYGESAQQTSKSTAPKYSFSMRSGDGSNRVQGMKIEIFEGNTLFREYSGEQISHILEENNPHGSLDFSIPAQGEMLALNGTTSLLRFGVPSALSVLNNDSHAGNDNGGSDGSALARVAVNGPTVELPNGSYTIRVSSSVKGIEASGTVASISTIRRIHIVGEPSICNSQNGG